MFFCHFSKVNVGISWRELSESTRQQVSNNCRQLKYKKLTQITLPQTEFEKICNDVSKPYPCYRQFAPRSLTDSQGIWHCIVLKDKETKNHLVLYTAGRAYPLYAAIIPSADAGQKRTET